MATIYKDDRTSMDEASWGLVLFCVLTIVSYVAYFKVAAGHPGIPKLPFLLLPFASLYPVPSEARGEMLGVIAVLIPIGVIGYFSYEAVIPVGIMAFIGSVIFLKRRGFNLVVDALCIPVVAAIGVFSSITLQIPTVGLPDPSLYRTFQKINAPPTEGATSSPVQEPVQETLEQRVQRENERRLDAQPQPNGVPSRSPAGAIPTEAIRPTVKEAFPSQPSQSAFGQGPLSLDQAFQGRVPAEISTKFNNAYMQNTDMFLNRIRQMPNSPMTARLTECQMRIRDPGRAAGEEGVKARQDLMNCVMGVR